MIFNDVIKEVENGQIGKNTGLSMGHDKLINYIPNLQRKNMYIIGGETGTGKSAYAMNSFVFNPYDDWYNNYRDTTKFKIFLWSMEMDKNIVLTKAICRKLYNKYNILTDVNFVLSRGKNRINQEVYDKVLETKNYFEEFEDRVVILNGDNPTGIRNTIRKYMLENGVETYKKIQTNEIDEKGNKKIIKVFDKYIPNNPNFYVVSIFDHIGLLKGERGFNKKGRIDKLVEYMIDYRDRYGITPVMVQQLNRNMSSTARFQLGTVEPQLSDFKETADTTDAANFVMALFNPQRYEIGNYRKYNIGLLKDRFRSLKILKTRDGVADIIVGLKFLGEIGQFFELPMGHEMTTRDYELIQKITKNY